MTPIAETAIEALVIYGLFTGSYFVFGFVLTRYVNKSKPKLQERECPPQLISRDIKQSTISYLSIALFLAIGHLLQRAGIGFRAAPLSTAGVGLSLITSVVIYDAWFYWGHRLIHLRPLYRHVHRWHHRTVTPTVWSTNSDSLLDNCFLQSYFLVAHLLFPIHAYVLLAHKLVDHLTAMLGHSGHEYAEGRLYRFPSPLLKVRFHDQHHEFFKYNFGTTFCYWDWLMGTLHPTYIAATREGLGRH